MLKKIRITLSVLFFGLTTFFFLDFADILPNKFHVLAHIQLVPAIMSLSFVILAVLVVLTLVLGRIYCSVICPMGVFQDIVNRISRKTAKKKKTFPLLSCQESVEMECADSYSHFLSLRIYGRAGVVGPL